ncbi:MAG TPA: serine/threonine-protein kinase, partial [Vicinamibacteria bacterium]
VMELVKGETLGELLEKGRPTLAESIRIAGDVLEALSFAHARGIVHRDVKPSNIMVTADRRAKIMDFGIAHVMGSELTAGVELLGSPYYMAPEQLSKGPLSARTDLFSFAVVLYRMLTGVLPFTGDSFAAVAHAILHEKPVAPHRVDPAIPRAISELVLKCLEKSPRVRAASASDVLRALDAGDASILDSPAKRKGTPTPARRAARFAIPLALVLALFAAVRFRDLVADENKESIPEVVAPPPLAMPLPALPPEPPERGVSSPVSPPVAPRAVRKTLPSPTVVEPERAELEPPEPVKPRPQRTKSVPPPPASPPPRHDSPSEADLFYQAQLAAERGEPERSRQLLDALLERNPAFAGASELWVTVTDQIWEMSLPLTFPAKHRHRVGGCEGELSLASLGVRFHSAEHDLAFRPEDIRVMEHPEETEFFVETFEKDLLALGKNKRYRFELEKPLEESDWVRYQRLLK